MEAIYEMINTIMPFSFLKFDFMKNAFLAILLVTPLFGLIGTMVVNNKMAFFSDSIGHSALTGVALGVILGITSPTISMIIFAILFAYFLNIINNKRTSSTDTIISVFSSTAIALGLLLLAKNGGINKYSSYLVGDILSINKEEIIYLFITLIITIIFWISNFNKILAISINKTLAKSKGINVRLIENAFVILIAVVVMLSIKWVGVLLINALLILPAASSRNISTNMRQYHAWSVIFSMISGISGVMISYYYSLATGSTIVLISALIFFITYFASCNSKN